MSETLRILVVEDNPADADFIREILTEITGPVNFRIETMTRLSEGITRLEKEDIDLVLLDLSLPDSQGLQTLHQFRKAAPDVPVVVLTGSDDLELAVAALRDGAQDYLVKGQFDGNLLLRTTRYARERQKIETTLRASEALLLEAQTIASLGSYVMDIVSGKWRGSEMLDRLFGIDKTYECSVEGWAGLIHPDDRAVMTDYFKNQVVGKGQAFDKEYRIIRQNDQAERWVHGLGRLEFDAQGRPVKMFGTIQDITEHQRAEAALEKSHEEFKDLFDNAPIGFHEIDAEGRLVRINKTELSLLGYTAEELLGQFVWKLAADEGLSRRACLTKLGGEPPPPAFERMFRRKDGSPIPVLINDRLLKRDDGNIIGIRATVQDNTGLQQATEKIKDQLDELRRWQDVMLDREDRVQELKREVNELCRRAGLASRYSSQTEILAAAITGKAKQ